MRLGDRVRFVRAPHLCGTVKGFTLNGLVIIDLEDDNDIWIGHPALVIESSQHDVPLKQLLMEG